MLRKAVKYATYRIRRHKVRKAHAKGLIPGWWDFEVDCGFTDNWYRCRKCFECGHR